MRRTVIEGPAFEDLKVGRVFDEAPSVTFTEAHQTLYGALTGDRMALSLDATLARAVTGRPGTLIHPTLVCSMAIGQSTIVTQRVRANLFYRDLVLMKPVRPGDTLRTTTEVVAMRRNGDRPGRAPTGVAVLRIRSEDQHGDPVLDFFRAPMLPVRDPAAAGRWDDDVDAFAGEPDPDLLAAVVPCRWDLGAFRARVDGPRGDDLEPGETFSVAAYEPVSSAPELVRMCLNIAAVHTDPAAGPYDRPLVYGAHTVAIAGSHVTRALPNVVTIVAWAGCDHTGPVFEGDLLHTEVTVDSVRPLAGGHALASLRVITSAVDEGRVRPVLDWRPVVLLA